MFNSEEQALRAEVLEAFHVANSNYSISSSENDNERFKIIFPDSKIAHSYHQGKSKVRYKYSVWYSSTSQANVDI